MAQSLMPSKALARTRIPIAATWEQHFPRSGEDLFLWTCHLLPPTAPSKNSRPLQHSKRGGMEIPRFTDFPRTSDHTPKPSWYPSVSHSCFLRAGGASPYAALLNILLYFLTISLQLPFVHHLTHLKQKTGKITILAPPPRRLKFSRQSETLPAPYHSLLRGLWKRETGATASRANFHRRGLSCLNLLLPPGTLPCGARAPPCAWLEEQSQTGLTSSAFIRQGDISSSAAAARGLPLQGRRHTGKGKVDTQRL